MSTVYALTAAERAELRKEKKQWNEFIRRMKKKGALIIESVQYTAS